MEKQSVEGKNPNLEASITLCDGETALCWGEGEPWVDYTAYEDGTDRVFRNVGIEISDAGESSKRKNTAFRIWQKFEIKSRLALFHHHHHHHHKHQGLDPLIRSVSTVTAARANASSVFQLFSFIVV